MTAKDSPGGSAPAVVSGVYAADGRPVPCPDWRQAAQRAVDADGFVWLGLTAPDAPEFAEIAAVFSLPPLAVEDAVRAHQRPKLERYGDVVFVVVKPARYVDSEEVVELAELAVFLGQRFVVVVRHGDSLVPTRVRAELDAGRALAGHGPSAVLYRLLDLTVDGYGDVVGDIQEDLDDIESEVFGGQGGDHAERVYSLKREVLELRRAVLPLAGPTGQLAAGEVPGVNPELLPFFRDVHDHVLRAAEAVDADDKLLTDVLQAYLAQAGVRQNRVATRQNEDMRKISAWAAIALVPTAIAGIYGMNFDNMPELRTRYGYYVVLTLILVVCVGLYVQFRRRRWL